MKHRLNSPNRGYVLGLALVFCFFVLTLILGLATSQEISVAGSARMERLLQNEQALAFEQLRLLQGVQAKPTWLKASVTTNLVNTTVQDWSGQLFSLDNQQMWALPSLRQGQSKSPFGAGYSSYPGHLYASMGTSKTQQSGVNLNQGFLVSSQFSPYAAWSDQGSVTISNVSAWSNPLNNETNPPDPTSPKNLSSTAPSIFGQDAVTIANFPYGFAWTAAKGPSIKLNTDSQTAKPAAVGYAMGPSKANKPPGADMSKTLRSDLNALKAAVEAIQSSGDRTPQLNEQIGILQTMGLFFTQYSVPSQLRNNLSLQESQHFPLPVLPGIALMDDTIWVALFHTPYTPDGGLDKAWQNTVMGLINDILSILEPLEWLISEINSLQNEVDHMSNWDPAKYALEATLIALKAQVEMIESLVEIPIAAISTFLEAALATSGQRAIAQTRSEESSQVRAGWLSKSGSNYWAYRAFADSLGTALGNLVQGKFTQMAQSLYGEVSLTFFGQPNKKQSWNWGGSQLTSRASWTVPRGRTLVFKQGLSVQGDLWLQRGSFFCVNGDLNLSPGDNGTQGTINIEEGATLWVLGNVRAAGSQKTGSLLVGSPLNAVHPITSCLFASGNIDLPYGTSAAVALDEVPAISGSGLSSVSTKLFRPLLQSGGAQLAKADGPFHSRMPYMATYATCIEMISIDGFPLIPWVGPLPNTNMLVFVHRALAQKFTPTLNLSLGENFMSHCDWWGVGHEEKSALRSKREIFAAQQTLSTIAVSDWPLSSSAAASQVTNLLAEVEPTDLDRLANTLCIQIGESVTQFLPDIEGGPPTGDIFNHIIDKLYQQYNVDDMDSQLSALVPTNNWANLGPTMNSVWGALQQSSGDTSLPAQCQEVPGILIYAGGHIDVGQGKNDNCLAAGMFVAEGDVHLNTQLAIGSAFSFNGSISGNTLLYYPAFTQASIGLPLPESNDWRQRAANSAYSNMDPNNRINIGKWPGRVLSGGWQ